MKIHLALVLVVSVCLLPGSAGRWVAPPRPQALALTPAQVEALVAAHNRYRAEVNVPALVWDPALARYAQTWALHLAAQGGKLAHRQGKHRQKDYGENLYMFWSTGPAPSADGQPAVAAWGEEKQYFQARQPFGQACQGGKCGHYTQLVWHSTRRVGCAAARYAKNNGTGVVWVCNYDPPGNWIGELVLGR
ncbi:MAG: CAP family protein [Bernardetiaceae bacterium]|nr:CAP family protein [Bernardetiaceae bacterium]